jgi:sigma-B regulation protein RsbU (phosphoserine phosphatase)
MAPSFDDASAVLSWRVTTDRALTRPVVPSFLAVLRRRLRQLIFDDEAAATALHEAVLNAAIHGNLGIAAVAQDGVEAAYILSQEVEARLKSVALASRPLVISAVRQHDRLILSVRDVGSGFAVDSIRRPDDAEPHGRGISLMRALARKVEYSMGGRLVRLTFALREKSRIETDSDTGRRQSFLLSSRILVADDSAMHRDMVSHWLRDAGFTDIFQAINGDETIRLFHEIQPDLILLDLAMPGTDGLEVCRTLNTQNPGSVPMMMVSSVQDPDARVRAFDAGAVDFIAKPVHPPELIARVRTQLHNRWQLYSLHQFRARLGDELITARLMQEALMPTHQILQTVRGSMGLDIFAHNEMSSELGGDAWGVRIIDEGRVGLYIADFTGHGAASAVNAFRLHALLGETGIRFDRPDLVMQALNTRLAGVLPVGSFATLFYGVIDTVRDRLYYAAAGAPSPVLAMPDGSLVEIDTTGVPAGIKPWHDYPVKTLPLPPGASLLLYSDALLETPDQDGTCWTMEHLSAVLAPNVAAGSDQQVASLLGSFACGRPRPLPDDLTVIFVRRIIEVAALAAA